MILRSFPPLTILWLYEYNNSLCLIIGENNLTLFTHKRVNLQKSIYAQLVSTLGHYGTYILQLKFVYLMNIFKEIFCFI